MTHLINRSLKVNRINSGAYIYNICNLFKTLVSYCIVSKKIRIKSIHKIHNISIFR